MLGNPAAVIYKQPGNRPRSNPDGNIGRNWNGCVFLVYSRSSSTYLIGTPDGRLASPTSERRHGQSARLVSQEFTSNSMSNIMGQPPHELFGPTWLI